MRSVISTPMLTLLTKLSMLKLWRHVPLLSGARNRYLQADVDRNRAWAMEFLPPLFDDVLESGSSVICNPPVLDTDIDFFVLFDCHMARRDGSFCDICLDQVLSNPDGKDLPKAVIRKAPAIIRYEELSVEAIDELLRILDRLKSHGFRVTSKIYSTHISGGSFPEFEDKMLTLRKGRINLIILFHKEIFMRYRLATQMAKARNITDKKDRVKFFGEIVSGNTEIERVVFGRKPGWRYGDDIPF